MRTGFMLLAALSLLAVPVESRDRHDQGFVPVPDQPASEQSLREYEEAVLSELDEIDARLTGLEERSAEFGFFDRRRAKAELRSLRRQQDEVEERLRALRLSGSPRWDIVKGGLEGALLELKRRLDSLGGEPLESTRASP